MSVTKEYRNFFLRNSKVAVGIDKDQEATFPVEYTITNYLNQQEVVSNRFIDGGYPNNAVWAKLFETLPFTLDDNTFEGNVTLNGGLVINNAIVNKVMTNVQTLTTTALDLQTDIKSGNTKEVQTGAGVLYIIDSFTLTTKVEGAEYLIHNAGAKTIAIKHNAAAPASGTFATPTGTTIQFPVDATIKIRITDAGGAQIIWQSATNSYDVPVGTILPFAGTTAPAGFLACDGKDISDDGDGGDYEGVYYEALWDVLKTNTENVAAGTGAWSTGVCLLPDLGEKFLVGYDSAVGTVDVIGEIVSNDTTGGATPMESYTMNYIIKY